MAVSLQENNWFLIMAKTQCPYRTRSLPTQFTEKTCLASITGGGQQPQVCPPPC
jgi:hypothetical protein